MSKAKGAVKKSISFPSEMAEWLNSEQEKTGVSVSKTVQKAILSFRKRKLRLSARNEDSEHVDQPERKQLLKGFTGTPKFSEPSVWSLHIMEARDFHAAYIKKNEEVEIYEARSERTQDAQKRHEMLTLAEHAREQAKILRDAFMHAIEEARKEDHHKEALQLEQEKILAYTPPAPGKNDYGFSGPPSSQFSDLEKAYEEARKILKTQLTQLEGKEKQSSSSSNLPALHAMPSADIAPPKKNGTR